MTNILARHEFEGPYGFHGEAVLARRGDRYYLSISQYCGEGSLEGGMMRDHLYEIPAEMLEEVRDCVERPDAHVNETTTRFDYLREYLLGDQLVVYMGRKRNLGWAAEIS